MGWEQIIVIIYLTFIGIVSFGMNGQNVVINWWNGLITVGFWILVLSSVGFWT